MVLGNKKNLDVEDSVLHAERRVEKMGTLVEKDLEKSVVLWDLSNQRQDIEGKKNLALVVA